MLYGPRLIAPDESEIKIFEVGTKGKYSAKCKLIDGTQFNVCFNSPQTSVADVCASILLPAAAFARFVCAASHTPNQNCVCVFCCVM
jgi:hypothetical protein